MALPALHTEPQESFSAMSDRSKGRVSVIVPVYNEVAHVDELLQAIQSSPVEKEIIVVDDGSTDGTREKLQAFPSVDGLTLVFHERNYGKGAAVRTALAHARGEYVLIQDSDLEYDPQEWVKLYALIADGRADVVFGSRFAPRENRPVLKFWHTFVNRMLTRFSNMFSDTNLTDMETCYKMFRRDVLGRERSPARFARGRRVRGGARPCDDAAPTGHRRAQSRLRHRHDRRRTLDHRCVDPEWRADQAGKH